MLITLKEGLIALGADKRNITGDTRGSDKTTQRNDAFYATNRGAHRTEGTSDTSTETVGEKDKYEVTDSKDTVDGGSHRIEGEPHINNETDCGTFIVLKGKMERKGIKMKQLTEIMMLLIEQKEEVI